MIGLINNQDYLEFRLSNFFLISNNTTRITPLIYPIVENTSAISYLPGCNAEKMKKQANSKDY